MIGLGKPWRNHGN